MSTQPMSMSVYNDYFQRVKPKNSNTLQLKRGWDLWYNGLSWYNKNVGAPNVLRDAESRMTAFRVMNGEPAFGQEPMHSTIRLGSTGPDVSAWQKVLNINQTGVFDTTTQSATKNYQAGKGLTVDGVVGPATWGTVPPPAMTAASVLSTYKARLGQAGPIAMIGIALVAGGLAAATLTPIRK